MPALSHIFMPKETDIGTVNKVHGRDSAPTDDDVAYVQTDHHPSCTLGYNGDKNACMLHMHGAWDL